MEKKTVKLTKEDLRKRARNISLLILDVDGVLTDGRITYTSDGKEIKSFDAKDGHGIVLARDSKFKIALISGRNSPVTEIRANELKIDLVFQGIRDKKKALRQIMEDMNIGLEQVAYVGDDVIDIPVMEIVGLSVAVADAHPKVLQIANWVTERRGGRGAVREFVDLLMES